ncbi:MAG: flagellar biosynthesis protein FlhB [Caldisericaceae bacterium]|nr:flagellar biosynthesis protein FlhB [Caldisericaceae bacterium]
MADTAQERTEQPTPRRREEAREKGRVAKSTELNSVVVLITGIFSLKLTLEAYGNQLADFLTTIYQDASTLELNTQTIPYLSFMVLKVFAFVTLPVLISIMIAGVVINFVQVGPLLASKAMKPDFSKMNPFKGIKNMFSLNALVELIKGNLKILIVGLVGYLVIDKYLGEINNYAYLSVAEQINLLGMLFLELSAKVGVVLLVMALADFAYQKYQYEKSLKMSKQEVKDEAKQYDGNPQIKSAIRSKQMQMARMRMMKEVPEATVVVTNPTHIAIALKYEPKNKQDAPIVVAKGKLKLAERIKAIAQKHGVPIIENKPLARGLYDVCEVGKEIPAAFYQAVAEVLSQVYKMNKAKLPELGEING